MAEEKMNQDQIDNLIKSIDAKKSKLNYDQMKEQFQNYDFNRPDKFLKQNISSLESIANVFARGFSQIMSASLRVPINFRLHENFSVEPVIQQVPYDSEYIASMSKDRAAFCITDLGETELGMIIVEIDLALALPIQRNLLGAGRNISIEDERKPLTDIEKIAMKEWVEEILYPELESAFRNVTSLRLSLRNIETDPQYVKITRPTDMIALIPFDVEVGTGEHKNGKSGVIKLGIPYLSIEPVIEKLTTENASEYKMDKQEAFETETIKHHLSPLKQNVEVELGKSEINFKEVLELTEGDVLQLNNRVTAELIGYISKMPKFSCVPGKKGKRISVKVTSFAKKEEAEKEDFEKEEV